jgi:hypothetical protein
MLPRGPVLGGGHHALVQRPGELAERDVDAAHVDLLRDRVDGDLGRSEQRRDEHPFAVPDNNVADPLEVGDRLSAG